MADLAAILQTEVKKYAGSGRGHNLRLLPLLDVEHHTYAVNAVQNPRKNTRAGVVVLARLLGDKIIIEEDATDKPLVDALIQQGIPRENIILAYAGEIAPDAHN